ncbi:MAG: N-acetylglucosamine-6-phosphate deacetylase, partial [Candidatus Limnocylindrales bacterium]
NGGFGHDFTHEPDAIWEVGTRLPQFGITGFVPTVVTSDMAAREAMLSVLATGPPKGYRGATPLGAHFEGPFLSPKASGAHDPAYLRVPSDADPDVARWSSQTGVRMVTLAPELDGAIELINAMTSRGVVVSAGHSAANRDQAVAAFEAGIAYATHLFNAMPPLGHRQPGLAGAALVDPRVTVGLIADGLHVHRDVIRIAAQAAGHERVSLVTDATAGLGMDPGRYLLGGRDVVVDPESVRLADDGRLAGSALTADEALRRFASMSGWSATDVLATMTSTPQRLLGLTDRGALRVGARADMAVLTPDLRIVGTFVGGEPMHGPWG